MGPSNDGCDLFENAEGGEDTGKSRIDYLMVAINMHFSPILGIGGRSPGVVRRYRVILPLAMACLAGLAIFTGPLAGGTLSLRAEEAVTIPDFWDPRHRPDTPRTDAIPSIRFLTSDDFPPFNFIDGRGQLAGFHVDLARALCLEFKLNCTIQARPFAELVTALLEGKGDAVIAGISPDRVDPDRLEFSHVYMRLPARFVARRGEAGIELKPEALTGTSIAVVRDTVHSLYLRDFFANADIRMMRTIDDARRALKSGEVKLLFADGFSTSFWLAGDDSEQCCIFVGGPYLEPRYFGRGFAIAVNRGNHVLRAILDYGLRRLYEKGVYAELYLRYFPVGFF